jgi:PadR family transcriptional regulator, regulatory protein PadR
MFRTRMVHMPLQLDSEETILKPSDSAIVGRPRTWLVPVILLSLRESTSYGYELMERTAAFGFGVMNPGTLYRTLRHMEKDGLCESEWDTTSGGGAARRMYSVTDAGEAYLDFWAKALEQYQRNLEAFFSLYMSGPCGSRVSKDE